MTKEEKIKLAIEKGYTCNPKTGVVYGMNGKELIRVSTQGYNEFRVYNGKKPYIIKSHQFIYYCVYNKTVDIIDHINGNRLDNRIENLRSLTNQQNSFNSTKANGFFWHKQSQRWRSKIVKDGQHIYLGSYDNAKDAEQAYLNAKKIYHTIDATT